MCRKTLRSLEKVKLACYIVQGFPCDTLLGGILTSWCAAAMAKNLRENADLPNEAMLNVPE